MKKNVVIVSGGNGSVCSLLALKPYIEQINLSAVVPMTDSGGSSGKLREEFATLPSGDVLRAMLALSSFDFTVLKKIFYATRFTNAGKLSEHNLGNLFLTLANEYTHDYRTGVRALEQALNVVGHVYPVTLDPAHLVAELSDGQIIKTEGAIDRPTYDRSLAITRVWLEPNVEANSDTQAILANADAIIFGPGSLYCSIIATLLPRGVRAAIGESHATLMAVVASGYEAHGETGPTTVHGYIEALEQFLPRPFDCILYNSAVLDEEQRRAYTERQWAPFSKDPVELAAPRYIGRSFETPEGGVSSALLGPILQEILHF